jgi:predicted DCC family thiol-disulfide oxidoreductase YuxK
MSTGVDTRDDLGKNVANNATAEQPREPATAELQKLASIESLPARIIFFDGVCAFCNGAVRWLRDRDPGGRFHFAPLQGETAALVRSAFPNEFPTDIDTLVYVERRGADTRIGLRSEAVFRLCDELGGGWRAVARLRALPRWLTDFGYLAFARSRYRVFGRLDACAVPTHGQRERLLP